MKCPKLKDKDILDIIEENKELRKLLNEVLIERNYYKDLYDKHRERQDSGY